VYLFSATLPPREQPLEDRQQANSIHVDSPAHELTRICAAAVIFIKGVSPPRLLSISALLEPGLKLMDMYERDLRDLLEWKIARYRALAREASDDQTARRIQALVRELELQLRGEQPDAG